MIHENRTYEIVWSTYEIAWIRMERGKYETRLLKIMYNKLWGEYPYRIYNGTCSQEISKTKEGAYKILLEDVLCYMEKGWQIELGHFHKLLF